MAKSIRNLVLLTSFLSLFSVQVCLAEATPSPALSTVQNITEAQVQNINTVIPNFGVVSDKLLRGAQPLNGGLAALKKAGVKTIVNLRDGTGDIESERAIAKKLGLNFVSIPLSAFSIVTKPQVEKFLATVRDKDNGLVFVHCRQGMDRCGTMVAIYRMNEQNWTAQQSYNEMLKYGFHPFLIGLRWSVFADEASNLTANGTPTALPPLFPTSAGQIAPIIKELGNSIQQRHAAQQNSDS